MKMRKTPMRSCVVSREQLPKGELFRIVRTPEGSIIIDNEKGKTNGRGAYLKKDLDIIERAKKIKILEQRLETKIDDEIYEKLKSLI